MTNGKGLPRPPGSARTAEIPLTRGLVAIVDADMADQILAMGKWHAAKDRWTTYARRNVTLGNGQQGTIRMHNVVLGVLQVDHINGNGLDNRRSNLRPATNAQNQRNKRLQANSTSGYKGVSWDTSHDRWRAEIRVDGRRVRIGRFTDPVEAAKAYDEAAAHYFGEFARLNFPAEAATR